VNVWCCFGAYLPRGFAFCSARFAKIGGIYNAVKSKDFLVLPVRIELTTSPLPRVGAFGEK